MNNVFKYRVVTSFITLMFTCAFLSGCAQNDDGGTNTSTAKIVKKPHVLFISIDDLRPMLASYGDPLAKTPNLDLLASQGVQFNNAYAQQAICGPSRASVLTGMRPDTLEVTHNYVKFRHKLKDVVTIPQYFIENGYNAAGFGKVFHHGDKDEALAWNWQPAIDKLPEGIKKPSRYALKVNNDLQDNYRKKMRAKYGEQAKFGLGSGPAFESADVPDSTYKDGYTTELAKVTVDEMLALSNKPLFIGFGMNKPHLPWIAPKKYWDMYDPKEIALTNKNIMPTSAPEKSASMGIHASFELRTFYNVPNYGEISPELAVELRHAYLACVSYVDAQIGKMLAHLKEKNILDETIIVVWSDHGYHLGDMGIWGKASNYEIATRVPLIISTPEMRNGSEQAVQGQKSNALVELIDIYPTLAELAGLPITKNLEGLSLVPLLSEPSKVWKTAAFSQFPTPALREWGAYPLRQGMRETYFGKLIVDVEKRIKAQQKNKWDRELFEKYLMGYSMRTERYRFIAWLDKRDLNKAPLYIELYDHKTDKHETVNVAGKNDKTVKELLKQLLDHLDKKARVGV
ncbi:sulfatase [Colwellia sp. UCD-KL20]|uniref:sulfatase n=1 Tax=Colwellia sp. UCD-KL20 TaxID=1917165 RepID=UPI0009FB6046|nr:sulfatase [Colwellia sp. UCD-KL20]